MPLSAAPGLVPDTKTADYTTLPSDVGKYIQFTGGVCTLGDVAALHIRRSIVIRNETGAEMTILPGAGITMTGPATFGNNQSIEAFCTGTNEWDLTGPSEVNRADLVEIGQAGTLNAQPPEDYVWSPPQVNGVITINSAYVHVLGAGSFDFEVRNQAAARIGVDGTTGTPVTVTFTPAAAGTSQLIAPTYSFRIGPSEVVKGISARIVAGTNVTHSSLSVTGTFVSDV